MYNIAAKYNGRLLNMEKSNVTVRLEANKIALLDQLAKHDDRDRSYLIKLAIDQYLASHQWRIEETKKAIAEADAGDFASDEEMERLFAKWNQ
jgi:predicted transcriptional regulator